MSALRASGALFVSNSLALGLQFVVVGCYGRRLGEEGLADYFVVLSLSNALVPILTGGLNDALSYLLGRLYAQPREAQEKALLSILFLSATTLLLALVTQLFPEWMSRLAFEKEGQAGLVLATLLFMYSRSLFDFQSRYLLARKQVVIPVLSMILIPGVIPLAVLWIDPTQSLERLLLEASILTLILLAIPCWREYRQHAGAGAFSLSLVSLRDLLKLGIPRIPTIFGMSLLVSCQPYLARKMHCSADELAIIGGAMMIVRTLTMAQRVVTSVVEPQIGWTSQNQPRALPILLRSLTLATGAVGVGATASLFAAGDTILRLWMERPDLEIGLLGRLFWISALPFTLLFVLRPCVNALSPQAHNTKNMFHSLIGMGSVLLIAWCLAAPPALAIGFATLLSATLMAVFSLTTVQKLVPIYSRMLLCHRNTLLFFIASVLLMALGYWGAPKEDFPAPRLLFLLTVVACAVVLYLGKTGFYALRSYRQGIRRMSETQESQQQ